MHAVAVDSGCGRNNLVGHAADADDGSVAAVPLREVRAAGLPLLLHLLDPLPYLRVERVHPVALGHELGEDEVVMEVLRAHVLRVVGPLRDEVRLDGLLHLLGYLPVEVAGDGDEAADALEKGDADVAADVTEGRGDHVGVDSLRSGFDKDL